MRMWCCHKSQSLTGQSNEQPQAQAPFMGQVFYSSCCTHRIFNPLRGYDSSHVTNKLTLKWTESVCFLVCHTFSKDSHFTHTFIFLTARHCPATHACREQSRYPTLQGIVSFKKEVCTLNLVLHPKSELLMCEGQARD